MKKYEMLELAFQGEPPSGSWAEADIQAEFSCRKEDWKVKGFYDGGGIYKVRFLPVAEGEYTWKVYGVVEASGKFDCVVSEDCHGMVQAKGNHFVYQDGTRYLPFGTTVYGLVHQPDELIEQTLKTLEDAPFNKLRHCIFPKHYDYSHNEPQLYPFEKDADGNWDVNRPCFTFWQHLENLITRLALIGIESDLILFHSYDRWGFADFSMEQCRIYLDYVLRRLASYPYIWWSMANEYDLIFNRTMEEWYTIEKIIKDSDPYGHLLSNHNGMKFYDFTRPDITHCCVQTTAMHKADKWQAQYGKPVIYDECCYEGDLEYEWGNISGFEMVNRFWEACSKGAYASHGETFYSEDEIIWWAKGGVLKGTSPERIGFLKKIMYSLPSYVEPWTEFSLEQLSGSGKEHPLTTLKKTLSSEEFEIYQCKRGKYTGHCGKDVYLKYFGIQCPRVSFIRLPEDEVYRIDIIDVWEMTREVLLEKSSGHTKLNLPGKVGIAVLAVKI